MIKMLYDCPEEVENMPKTSCGHFCDACKHDVYDFRGKTLMEIKQIKEADPSIKCGIFDDEVVQEDTRNIVSTLFRMAFAAVFIFGFNAGMLFGQTVVHYPDSIQSEVNNENAIVTGNITDHKGNPIADAQIVYYTDTYTSAEIKSDENGHYRFEIPENHIGKDFYFYVYADDKNSEFRTITSVEGKQYIINFELKKAKKKKMPYRRGRTAGVPAYGWEGFE